MNKDFIAWLEEQRYDWNTKYNYINQIEGRIWMLKHVHDFYYPESSSPSVYYSWGGIIIERKHTIINYK